MSEAQKKYYIFKGVCSDKKCHSPLYFFDIQSNVECLQCGQSHDKANLQEVQPATDVEEAVKSWIRFMFMAEVLPKRGYEMTKVLGLSNYFCKLLSPLLTRYGMDKSTGRAKLLSEMNQGDIIDCSIFSDRAFLVEHEHLDIVGFGRDQTGSTTYLSETLNLIVSSNEEEERLIPIHADGDGHCLVHAVSRALIGRELFWHPLRCCLKKHFQDNIDNYKMLFKDFVDEGDWTSIIEECDPEFRPTNGELHGLRPFHIFGLANILKRPIILLDSLECMKKSADYSALFLPGLLDPKDCRGKDNSLNKPLCIAWSNPSHSHYIPLVGVKKRPLPILPSGLIPKVWGMPQDCMASYLEFTKEGNCIIGGNRVLSEAYILRLVSSMETVFFDQNNVHPTLVEDAHFYLYPSYGIPAYDSFSVTNKTRHAVQESRLYRCLSCNALCELSMNRSWFLSSGALYNMAQRTNRGLNTETTYFFPLHGIYCKYDMLKDMLVPILSLSGLNVCTWCRGPTLRKVKSDGTLVSRSDDKDRSDAQSQRISELEYISLRQEVCDMRNEPVPQRVWVLVTWDGRSISDTIDVCLRRDDCLAEVVYKHASEFIQKHFPGENRNDLLHCSVGQQIMDHLKQSVARDLYSVSLFDKYEEPKCLALTKKPEPTKPVVVNPVNNSVRNNPSPVPAPIVPNLEFVKVSTSDGRQENLTLSGRTMTCTELQTWIKNRFQIPISNQIIKYGFPPKPFQRLLNDVLSPELRHGEKIIVEICKEGENNLRNNISPMDTRPLFQTDVAWNLSKLSPACYHKNGAYYEKLKLKYGFDYAGMHMQLEEFPKKTFYYNNQKDSIDLCVKPYGHFQISQDIDSQIAKFKEGKNVTGFHKCPHSYQGDEPLNYSSNVQKMRSTTSRFPSSMDISDNQSEEKPETLVRKGPGFSVLTRPPPGKS